jgi:hypothetical protein
MDSIEGMKIEFDELYLSNFRLSYVVSVLLLTFMHHNLLEISTNLKEYQ